MKAVIRKTRLFETDEKTLTEILKKFMSGTGAENKAKRLCTIFQRRVVPESMQEICVLELHMLIQQYDLLKQQITRTERQLEKEVKKTNTHLLTIPGLGVLTAGAILGELGDLTRFTSSDQVTAYAGLDTVVTQSGNFRRTGHISKRGSPMLREALYHAALSAVKANPVCRQFYQRLRAKDKHFCVCLVAVSRKLLHIAYSVEKNNRDFYVPTYITQIQV